MTPSYREKAEEIVEAISNVVLYDPSYLEAVEKRKMTELITNELRASYTQGLFNAAKIAETGKFKMILSHVDLPFSARDKRVRQQARNEVAQAIKNHASVQE